jgi:hypothetical protein
LALYCRIALSRTNALRKARRAVPARAQPAGGASAGIGRHGGPHQALDDSSHHAVHDVYKFQARRERSHMLGGAMVRLGRLEAPRAIAQS